MSRESLKNEVYVTSKEVGSILDHVTGLRLGLRAVVPAARGVVMQAGSVVLRRAVEGISHIFKGKFVNAKEFLEITLKGIVTINSGSSVIVGAAARE